MVTTSSRVGSSLSITSCNIAVRRPELGTDIDASSVDENDVDIGVLGRGVLTSRCGLTGRARWRNGQGGDALVLWQSLIGVVPMDNDVQMRISSSTWDKRGQGRMSIRYARPLGRIKARGEREWWHLLTGIVAGVRL
jgi:hypothetical protein